MKKYLTSLGGGILAFFLLFINTEAVVLYDQSIQLSPGWNIVSTPKILESHTFSVSESSDNFDIYVLDPSKTSGWATLADLGQTQFTPLYGYFVNNKTGTDQTLTFNYKADTSPAERLFDRTFSAQGWYSIGIANSTYAKSVIGDDTDTDNPDNILNSLIGAYSFYGTVIDFTDASHGADKNSVALTDPWKGVSRSPEVSNSTEINSLNDFRETKGYAIYIKEAGARYNGFQNNIVPTVPQCADGVDNDTDTLIDSNDPECENSIDDSEAEISLNVEFNISTSEGNPEAGIVMIDDTDNTENVSLLKGKLKLDGDSDVTIDELPVTLTTVGGANVAAVTGSVTLKIGDEEYTESVSSSETSATIIFDNLDFIIGAGDTVEFEILADINDIESGNFDEGDSLKAEVTSTNRNDIDVEDELGEQLDDSTDKSGTVVGEAQEFRTEGIQVTLVSTNTSIIAVDGSNNDRGTFTIRFKVSAIGDTVYISSLIDDAVNYMVDKSGTPISGGISATITNVTDSSKTSAGNFTIEEGDVETFNLVITAELPEAGLNGEYRVNLTGIKWDSADVASPANIYSYSIDDFKTSYITLD